VDRALRRPCWGWSIKMDCKVKTVRSKTGVPGLDDILSDGLIPNRLYLVDGDPGSGKTTLSLQFLLEGLKDGEKCLYITLSETKEELTAGAESHGWSLDRIEIVELIADAKELNGDMQVTMYHPSEVEAGNLNLFTRVPYGVSVKAQKKWLEWSFNSATQQR
jgi:hypothetical protein